MNNALKTMITCLLLISNVTAQDNWKLPMANGSVQFEFSSNKIATGNKDLCDLYYAPNTYADLFQKLLSASTSNKVKLLTGSTFTISTQLYGADGSSAISSSCTTAQADTAIGSLTFTLIQTKLLGKARAGSIKCLFRIILKDNKYNIKFRAFKYTESKIKLGTMEVTTTPLEDEYNEADASKSDKQYWSDVNMIVSMFHEYIEEVLGSQASDFNFDD